MELIVDGIVYEDQAHGGISRLYSEILPRMCEIDNSLHITVLTSGWLRHLVPNHPHISHHALFPVNSLLFPRRLWRSVTPYARAFLQRSWLGDVKGKLWHSTYYTMLEKWNGPVVVTVYDMIHEHFSPLFVGSAHDRFRQQKWRCVLEADIVICISENTRKDLQQIYGVDTTKAKVVPLAHSPVFRPLEDLEHTQKSPIDRPFLLYVGNRTYHKNFTCLLHAYSIWPRRKEVDLVVVGKRWSKDEKQQVVKAGITGQVHLLRNVNDQKLCLLYNQASAFVYPSLYEGFGIPLLEAMACGCLIIASRIPSTIEVAGELPIYFDPIEVESLCIAFDLALSEGRSSKRVRLGLERVKQYSWDKTARQTLNVYHNVAQS